MDFEHLSDLKTGKPKFKVSCSICGKVMPDQNKNCPACTNLNQAGTPALTPSDTATISHASPLHLTREAPTSSAILMATPASFFQRFAATIIDEILLGMIMLAAGLMFCVPIGQYFLTGGEGLIRGTPDNLPPWLTAAAVAFALSYTLPYLYIAWFETSKLAATPGKYLMGLRVVSERNEPITLSDSLAKALTQTLLYIPVFILFSVATLFPIIYCLNKTTVVLTQSNSQFISFTLNILIIFLSTAAMTYPCFRKGSQSLMDLISNRFVVTKNRHETYSPSALGRIESIIHKFHYLTSVIFWMPAILLVLSIPSIIDLAFGNLVSDLFLGLGLLALSWIASLWLLWKFRNKAGNVIGVATSGIIAIALVMSTAILLPDYASKLSNTPEALNLIEQALAANQKGEKNNYEKLRLKARKLPSYAVSYYVMHNAICEQARGLPPETYCAPRLWAITSAPGVPFKEHTTKKTNN